MEKYTYTDEINEDVGIYISHSDLGHKYIKLENFEGPFLEIDDLLEPCSIFFEQLETECVSGCCGVDAFDFSETAIANVVKTDLQIRYSTMNALKSLKEIIKKSDKAGFISKKLAFDASKNTWLNLIDHIMLSIESVN